MQIIPNDTPPTVRRSVPPGATRDGQPALRQPAPRRPAPRRPAPADSGVPGWINWPVRAVVLVVVVPVRLLWELISVTSRFVGRWVLRPLGRLLRLLIWRPFRFLVRYLVVVPIDWLIHYLLVVPLTWLWSLRHPVGRFLARYVIRPLAWFLSRVIWPPLRWLVTYLVVVPIGWLVTYLLVVPVRWLVGVLAPVGRWLARAVVEAWRAAGWLSRAVGRGLVAVGRVLYRFLLCPIGLAIAWTWRHTVGLLWRGTVALFRATVVPVVRWVHRGVLAPMGRWLRDSVFRPAGEVVAGVLTALGAGQPARVGRVGIPRQRRAAGAADLADRPAVVGAGSRPAAQPAAGPVSRPAPQSAAEPEPGPR